MKTVMCVAVIMAAIVHAPYLSAETDWARVHTRTIAAIDHLYDLEFGAAERACNEVIGMAPGDPRGHFFKAMAYYYRMSFKGGAKNDTAFWAFVYHADRVREVCERLLDQNDRDTKAMFYLGGIIGFKGLASASRGDMMKAIRDGKEGYDLLEEAVEIDPANIDARMGLGMFRYMISQAPDFLSGAIRLMGMKGDRTGGLRLLEDAAAKGTYTQTEARRWLTQFYLEEDLPKRAIAHLDWLRARSPKNWYFHQLYADVQVFQLKNAAGAEPVYRQLLTLPVTTGDDQYVRWIACQRLGYISMAREQYNEAAGYYSTAYGLKVSNDRKYESANALAQVRELAGDRDGAMEWLRKAGPSQGVAQRLATPWNAQDKVTVRVQTATNVGSYARAAIIADSALRANVMTDPIQRSQVRYYQGVACLETSRLDEAATCFTELTRAAGADAWVHPFSHYRLGMVMARQGKTTEARAQFAKALEFEDYPSEATLRKRVARERQLIDRRGG